MKIEYEATFVKIAKEEAWERLKKAGGILIKPEFLQKRAVFNLPAGHEIKGGWLRVRDESDKITMSLKVVDGTAIENQKEILLEVNDFENAREILGAMGSEEKAYQENMRELWRLDDTEVTIDEWPFLEPFVEVEGESEPAVRSAAEKLGFDWRDAKFCAADTLYAEKYGLPEDVINSQTPRIVFDMHNPFIK